MKMIDLHEWLDQSDEPMEPEKMQFIAEPGKTCKMCCFKRQRAVICDRANEAARKADLPECEEGGVIYRLAKIDPRQISIIE